MANLRMFKQLKPACNDVKRVIFYRKPGKAELVIGFRARRHSSAVSNDAHSESLLPSLRRHQVNLTEILSQIKYK